MKSVDSYETLRSWYLARLRKSAIEAKSSASLTPATLIAADREVVERLIAEKAAASKAACPPEQTKAISWKITACIWIYAIGAVLFAAFIFTSCRPALFVELLKSIINPLILLDWSNPDLPVVIVFQVIFLGFPLLALLRISGRTES